ncbi:hypothetical protein M9Y10_039628 [Tritrichomonas musculus]|uniref:Uncharacterized protein n=1 Tax=Tritrichomonas musculus TaxID=1915356 RepID=A0ABR2GQS6_9EUKA
MKIIKLQMATETASEIARLRQIIEALKQENLELCKHNELLQEEVSKLADKLEQVDEVADDDSQSDEDDTDDDHIEGSWNLLMRKLIVSRI